MANNTKQKSVLITGCSQGSAGNALALQFAAKGYRVFATARSLKSLVNLQEKGIETLTLDVTDPESIADLKAAIADRTGGSLDILFNNAGTLYEAPAIEADPARVRSMFDTNVFGLMDTVTAFTPLLLAAVTASNSPIIVNVGSVLARLPSPFQSAYNASKAAVVAYSDTLRLEVRPLGIKVMTIFMGEVSTGLMVADSINFGAESIYRDVEAAVKARTETHAAKTMLPAQFAREVVAEVIKGKSLYLWKGSNALLVWFLNMVGPRNVFDGFLNGNAGLSTEAAKSSIRKYGQELVKKNQ